MLEVMIIKIIICRVSFWERRINDPLNNTHQPLIRVYSTETECKSRIEKKKESQETSREQTKFTNFQLASTGHESYLAYGWLVFEKQVESL